MKELLEQIRQKARQELAEAEDSKGLEELRVRYLGKKGELTAILKQRNARLSVRWRTRFAPKSKMNLKRRTLISGSICLKRSLLPKPLT